MIRKHTTATPSLGDNFRHLAAQTKAVPPAERARNARAMLSWLREQEITKLKGLIRQGVSRETSAPGDESDRALLQEGIELQASLIGLSESRLAAIWAAFDRLEEDRYGICERCGDELPFERLRAMPMALRCVDCQAKFEAARDSRTAGGGLFEIRRSMLCRPTITAPRNARPGACVKPGRVGLRMSHALQPE